MCGRFSLAQDPIPLLRALDSFHGEEAETPFVPRYNIAPSQSVLVVAASASGSRRALRMQWGLVPTWAPGRATSRLLINARGETVAEKPTFRRAFLYRRCVVPADGFFEWRAEGGVKQPYRFCLRDYSVFGLAGLWAMSRDEDGHEILRCAIVTTEANQTVAPVHQRMPVIMEPDAADRWLRPEIRDPAQLLPLLRPYPAADMIAYPVSTRVNAPAHDRPDVIAPLSTDA